MDGRKNDFSKFIEDAVAAMERLVENYGEAGGDFLFDANYLIGQAKEKKKDFQAAAFHYESALNNSSWHENANDARMRMGNSFLKRLSQQNKKNFIKRQNLLFRK